MPPVRSSLFLPGAFPSGRSPPAGASLLRWRTERRSPIPSRQSFIFLAGPGAHPAGSDGGAQSWDSHGCRCRGLHGPPCHSVPLASLPPETLLPGHPAPGCLLFCALLTASSPCPSQCPGGEPLARPPRRGLGCCSSGLPCWSEPAGCQVQNQGQGSELGCLEEVPSGETEMGDRGQWGAASRERPRRAFLRMEPGVWRPKWGAEPSWEGAGDPGTKESPQRLPQCLLHFCPRLAL